MSLFYTIVTLLVSISSLIYAVIVLTFFDGWMKLPNLTPSRTRQFTKVSIIIACRNEEDYIIRCLESIVNNNYAKEYYEIIIVDDNSDDNSLNLIYKFSENHPDVIIKVYKLGDIGSVGKKEAIRYGVGHALNNLILTTDGDCVVPENWISLFVSSHINNQAKLICGPVSYFPQKGFFQQFQLLDFLSLVASSAGAIGNGKAFMSNAANMAFDKETFNALQKNRNDDNLASGDDIFLLHAIKKTPCKRNKFSKI
ncbi:MAG: glycosyltransferase [Bacteroidales bacterium]|nr:glycosyltransferase [Bacteroidales bacterium]